MSTTVRIGADTHRLLRELCGETGETARSLLKKALEAYRRQRFLEEANRAYAALKKDPKAWKQELAERRLWEKTLGDGLGSR